MLDVNPYSRTGIFTEDIKFVHLLLLYLASLPDLVFDKAAQEQAIADVKSAAVFGNEEIKRRAESVLKQIAEYTARSLPEFRPVIEYQQAKLREGNSYAERILKSFGSGYAEKALALAKGYQRGEGDV